MKKISPALLRLVVLLGILGLFASCAWWFGFFFFDLIRSWNGILEEFIRQHYALSIVLFILIYIIDNVFALPMASVMTMAAGFFYGPYVAIGMVTVAATSGATLSFLVSRRLVGNYLQCTYEQKLERFNRLFREHGTWFLLLVRLIPAIPFVMVNVLAGLTIVPLKNFFWTTLVGMLPVTTLLVLSGSEIQNASSFVELVSGKFIMLFLLLFLLLLLPLALKKVRLMV
ncbi:MAG: hypothetical protein UW09_C0002G0060 [candidate division TM6 bacterium GW2011_GWF2_43_87]|nr:MAG: hypothetical protein UW09_C0002G0060 [candidate division TM6 bacterium GW2011_GWF2_43_87]